MEGGIEELTELVPEEIPYENQLESNLEKNYNKIDENGEKYLINGQGKIYYLKNGRASHDVWSCYLEPYLLRITLYNSCFPNEFIFALLQAPFPFNTFMVSLDFISSKLFIPSEVKISVSPLKQLKFDIGYNCDTFAIFIYFIVVLFISAFKSKVVKAIIVCF